MPQHNSNSNSDLGQLAQIMQLVAPFQQQQQAQTAQQQLMQYHMQSLAQQDAERRAELAFKQQQLQQVGQEHTDAQAELRRNHDIYAKEKDQAEAAQAIQQYDKLGIPLTLSNPIHRALITRRFGADAPSVMDDMATNEAAKFMLPVQQAYAQHKTKPDLAGLQNVLNTYLPQVWDKLHPAVQAKMGEMFQGLNGGMSVAPSGPVPTSEAQMRALAATKVLQDKREAADKAAVLAAQQGQDLIQANTGLYKEQFQVDPATASQQLLQNAQALGLQRQQAAKQQQSSIWNLLDF